jgi:hypothetical protein
LFSGGPHRRSCRVPSAVWPADRAGAVARLESPNAGCARSSDDAGSVSGRCIRDGVLRVRSDSARACSASSLGLLRLGQAACKAAANAEGVRVAALSIGLRHGEVELEFLARSAPDQSPGAIQRQRLASVKSAQVQTPRAVPEMNMPSKIAPNAPGLSAIAPGLSLAKSRRPGAWELWERFYMRVRCACARDA